MKNTTSVLNHQTKVLKQKCNEEKQIRRKNNKKKKKIALAIFLLTSCIIIGLAISLISKTSIISKVILEIVVIMCLWIGVGLVVEVYKGEESKIKIYTLGSKVTLPYMGTLAATFTMILYYVMIVVPIVMFKGKITGEILYIYLTVSITLIVRLPRISLGLFIYSARLIDKLITCLSKKIKLFVPRGYREETDTKILFKSFSNAHSRTMCYLFALSLYGLLNAQHFGMEITSIKGLFFPIEIIQVGANKEIYKEAFLTFIIADSFVDQFLIGVKEWFGKSS